jgi:exodeoxyribonuclease V beta subunit
VVTYTRAATAELRERIGTRLRAALAELEGGGGRGGATPDALVARWRSAGRAERARERLRACLAALDQAAIFTVHGFCQRALREAAFESGADFELELLEDPRPLLDEIAADFWARRLSDLESSEQVFLRYLRTRARLDPPALVRLALRLLRQPGAPILHGARGADEPPGVDEWERSFAALRELWRRERGAVVSLLEGARQDLRQNSYSPRQICKYAAQMDAALLDGRACLGWTFEDVRRLSTTGIRAGLRSGRTAPEHPVFEACQALLDAEQRLEIAARARTQALLVEFAAQVRAALEARLAVEGLQTYDSLLTRLHAALDGEAGGALARQLRRSYGAALIDEFQDTDPLQYAIFRRVFGDGGLPLVLIGDPKQAIYAFRGADVFAYLRARREAGTRAPPLDVNHRADPGLIRALDALYGPAPDPFFNPEIVYRPVRARDGARDAFQGGAPLQILFAGRDALPGADELAGAIAAEIARLLDGPARVAGQAVKAGDVAVLCRTNRQASQVQDALRTAGIASALQGDRSVFDSDEAEDLERVLRALASPTDPGARHAALATRVLGLTAAELRALGRDPRAADAQLREFGRWHSLWVERGALAALRAMLRAPDAQHGASARTLLGQAGGERRLTNLLHLAELLQRAARQLHLGPLAQVRWLARMRADDSARAAELGEEQQIRLESDAHVVRLATVHRAKGLQYPIVYVPWAWTPATLGSDDRAWAAFHDGAGQLVVDLGSAEHDDHVDCAQREARAEAARLLYVALTRARHRLSLVWGAFAGAERSPLARLLGVEGERDAAAQWRALGALRARAPGALELVRLEAGGPPAAAAADEGAPPLRARALRHVPRRQRRISSFSGMVHAQLRPDDPRDHDGALVDLDAEGAGGRDAGPPVALADFPRSARAGVLIHELLEQLDFAVADPLRLGAEVERVLARQGFETRWTPALTRALGEVLEAPLEPRGALRLRDLPRARRLGELEFVLPVAVRSGATWLGAARLAAAFERFAAAELAAAYAPRLRQLQFPDLTGHLRGFIDLVFEHAGRWYLADYKSNHLGDRVEHYAPERLREAMLAHHYVLQYHLYALALHRYLRFRLPDYDYERHFGGALYLFVRGMAPSHPPGWGVYADRPPRALIEALSAALDGGPELRA